MESNEDDEESQESECNTSLNAQINTSSDEESSVNKEK